MEKINLLPRREWKMKDFFERNIANITFVGSILLVVIILMGIYVGNPFASHFTATVLVKDKEIDRMLGHATVEFMFGGEENGYKKGDLKSFAVNGKDNFAQLIIGDTADVKIRGGHIIYAWHNKKE